jgi:SAM-dependent methyltransferase
MSLGLVFDSIYKTGFWKDNSSASPRSGSGSKPENAKPYVDFVRSVVTTHHLRHVLDVGCGDFEMWREWQFTDIDYLGVDISQEATNLSRSSFSGANLRFVNLDLTEAAIVPDADLLLSKDCLQHLPNQVVLLLLRKFSTYEHLIICNDISVAFPTRISLFAYYLQPRSRIRAFVNFKSPFFQVRGPNNADIQAGDHRCVSLEVEPFADALNSHELIATFDYDGPRRDGMKKRVYYYRKRP